MTISHTAHLPCEALAHALFDEEWARLHTRTVSGRQAVISPPVGYLPYWLLPEMVALLAEAGDRPVTELEPAIRELVSEHQFVEESGDPVSCPHQDEATQWYVSVFMRVLERLREEAMVEGAWSRMPTTPQMFG